MKSRTPPLNGWSYVWVRQFLGRGERIWQVYVECAQCRRASGWLVEEPPTVVPPHQCYG